MGNNQHHNHPSSGAVQSTYQIPESGIILWVENPSMSGNRPFTLIPHPCKMETCKMPCLMSFRQLQPAAGIEGCLLKMCKSTLEWNLWNRQRLISCGDFDLDKGILKSSDCSIEHVHQENLLQSTGSTENGEIQSAIGVLIFQDTPPSTNNRSLPPHPKKQETKRLTSSLNRLFSVLVGCRPFEPFPRS